MRRAVLVLVAIVAAFHFNNAVAQTDDEMLENDWIRPIHGTHISQYKEITTMTDKNTYQVIQTSLDYMWGYKTISGMTLNTNDNGYIYSFVSKVSMDDWDEIYKRATCLYGQPDVINDTGPNGTILYAWLTDRVDFRLCKVPITNSVMIIPISKKIRG